MKPDPKRQTGRTDRMLRHACQLAAQGKPVYVIAANASHVNELKQRLPAGTSVRVDCPLSISNFNWDTLTIPGVGPDAVVLVDHYAIEARFCKLLEMLTRYDAKA